MRYFAFLYTAALLLYGCSKSPDTYVRLGISDFNSGHYTKAIEHLQKAVSLDQKNEEAYMYEAFSYYNLHRYDRAILFFSKVIELDPENSDAYKFRGLAEYYTQSENACQDLCTSGKLGNNRAYTYFLKYCK